jgi:hypothetical protein
MRGRFRECHGWDEIFIGVEKKKSDGIGIGIVEVGVRFRI